MVRPSSPDTPPKRTKKIRLPYTQSGQKVRPYQMSGLMSQDIKMEDTPSNWLIANLGIAIRLLNNQYY